MLKIPYSGKNMILLIQLVQIDFDGVEVYKKNDEIASSWITL